MRSRAGGVPRRPAGSRSRAAGCSAPPAAEPGSAAALGGAAGGPGEGVPGEGRTAGEWPGAEGSGRAAAFRSGSAGHRRADHPDSRNLNPHPRVRLRARAKRPNRSGCPPIGPARRRRRRGEGRDGSRPGAGGPAHCMAGSRHAPCREAGGPTGRLPVSTVHRDLKLIGSGPELRSTTRVCRSAVQTTGTTSEKPEGRPEILRCR